jgi:hypothetical protein
MSENKAIRMNSPRVREILEAREHGIPAPPIPVPPGPKIQELFPDGAWRGQRCFIVGGGPSLKGFDFGRLRGERVIAINKAFFDVPWADIMFSMDRGFLDSVTSGELGEDCREAFQAFEGAPLWLDIFHSSYPPGIYSLPSAGKIGWTRSLTEGLFHGQNSGYGALGLALILGADPIYLLGFDCSKGPRGETHYHDGYPCGLKQEDLDTFRSDFEAGAPLLPPGRQVINLNPNSALKCFEFGDVDRILPKAERPKAQTITAITPTGDRTLAFSLCRRWMRSQTRRPDQWIVVDDGRIPMKPDRGFQYVRREPQPGDPRHTLDLNMTAALPFITGDKILIIEDDEYYAPGYVQAMASQLDGHEVAGIILARYYHLGSGGYCVNGNLHHASLAQTGFRSSFLPIFTKCVNQANTPDWLDIRIWKRAAKNGLFLDSATPLYLGMKGLPGRGGIGMGHDPGSYQSWDKDRAVLKKWIPTDFQVYLDVLEGMK